MQEVPEPLCGPHGDALQGWRSGVELVTMLYMQGWGSAVSLLKSHFGAGLDVLERRLTPAYIAL